MNSAIANLATVLIEKIFPDKSKQDEAKLAMLEMLQRGELTALTSRAEIVKTEAASENFLTSGWRPIVMLTFTALIVARWFGWASPTLSEAEYLKLWDIVELGLGGYVIGRSAEKILPSIAATFKK